MAARRLLIVMLVLLGISSVIAVVVPEPKTDSPAPEESTVTGETGASGPDGEDDPSDGTFEPADGTDPVDRRTVDLDSRHESEVRAKAGGRMILTVRSATGSDVEIEGLGLAGFADPYAPAVFDVILPTEPGRYAVGPPGEDPAAVIVTD